MKNKQVQKLEKQLLAERARFNKIAVRLRSMKKSRTKLRTQLDTARAELTRWRSVGAAGVTLTHSSNDRKAQLSACGCKDRPQVTLEIIGTTQERARAARLFREAKAVLTKSYERA